MLVREGMGVEEVRKALRAAINIELNFQNDERVDRTFHRLFVDNKLSFGYLSRKEYVQKHFKLHPNKSLSWLRKLLRPVHVKRNGTPMP